METEKQIEAILFFRGEPVKIKELSKLLGISEDGIKNGIETLRNNLKDRGVQLISKDDEVMLGTSPEASELIEKVRKQELSKDIGKAGLETLSIVLYKGPIARSEIDYIRGVNSAFILRNLLIRGLVSRISNPNDQRSFLYKPTFELLTSLGVTNIKELPDYEDVLAELKSFVDEQDEENDNESDKI